jgi:hypothetical protein
MAPAEKSRGCASIAGGPRWAHHAGIIAHNLRDRDKVNLPGASCIGAPMFFSAKREGSKR